MSLFSLSQVSIDSVQFKKCAKFIKYKIQKTMGASHFLFVHPRFLSLIPFLASQLHPL